jgi:hypothetical protein
MTDLPDTGKGGAMLSEELLKVIQADRRREIAAAERVRWLRPEATAVDAPALRVVRVASHRPAPVARPHTGTGSAATDPCV